MLPLSLLLTLSLSVSSSPSDRDRLGKSSPEKDLCPKESLKFRQAKRKSSSELREELLSVECYKSGSCKLLGQFSLDFIGHLPLLLLLLFLLLLLLLFLQSAYNCFIVVIQEGFDLT